VLGVLAGCRETSASVGVREDRSATVTMTVVPSLAALESLGGEKQFNRIIKQYDEPSAGIRAKRVVVATGVGMQVTVEVDDVEQLTRPFPLPLPKRSSLQLFDRFDLAKGEDNWRLDAVARSLDRIGNGVSVIGGVSLNTTYEMKVTLPGRIEASNADVAEGGSGNWDLPTESGSRRLIMRSGTASPVSPVLALVLGAVALMLLGALLAIRAKDAASTTRIKESSKRSLRRRPKPTEGWGRTPSDVAAAPSVSSVAGAAPTSDAGADTSLAIPEPGAGWGPVPPEGATSGAVRPAPRVTAAGSGVATGVTPSSAPVVALDRGQRLGVPTDAAADPAGDSAPQVPPGWYADPNDPATQRFWDGTAWTAHRSGESS
ncbi:MAG: DUF2510 domain-containing protein, partial [Actinomycetes bacterium]